MIQSQEQLARVTDIVNGLDGQINADADNRRRLPRVPFRMQMKLTLLSDAAPTCVEVLTRNISASGIGFVCRRMFRPNERVALRMLIPKVPPKLVLARITFGRYVSGGLHEMGAEFIEGVPDVRHSEAGVSSIPAHWLLADNRKPSQPAPAEPAPAVSN